MDAVSVYRPHDGLGESEDKLTDYYDQYKYRVWSQLAYCIPRQWKKPLNEYPRLLETLKSVHVFKVRYLNPKLNL
jgi:hypothetical protein